MGPLQGVIKLMIGTTPDLSAIQAQADAGVKEASRGLKELQARSAAVTGGSLIAITKC